MNSSEQKMTTNTHGSGQDANMLSYLPLFRPYFDKLQGTEKKAKFLITLPLCAQQEILDAEGLRYDSSHLADEEYGLRCFVTALKRQTERYAKDSTQWTLKDFRNVARFVNSTTRFQRTPLLSALKHLQGFVHSQQPSLPQAQNLLPVFFGRPTNKRPRSLGPCILSRYALDSGIGISPSTTFEDLCNAFVLSAMTKEEVQQMLSSLSKHELVNVVAGEGSALSLVSRPCALDKNKLERKLANSTASMSSTAPNGGLRSLSSNEEFVAKAARQHGVDVSPSPCPRLEYWQLSRCSTCGEEYVPLSLALQSLYVQEFEENSPVRLSKRFNPLFRTLYTQAQLRRFALFEGYTEQDVQEHDAENLLLSLRKEPNVFRGKEGCCNTHTPVLFDKISECPSESCVTFCVGKGRRAQSSEDFQAIPLDELALVFSQYQKFANPFDNYSQLPQRIVNKLSNIAQLEGSEAVWHCQRQLLEAIERVRLLSDKCTQTVHDFVAAYSNLDDKGKEKVQSALRSLNELAMYMRGWSGEGEYPLEDTRSDMDVVEAKVVEELVHTKQALEDTHGMKEHILALPLVAYDNVREEWKTSTDPEAGRTIGERLNIVSGQSDSNIHSCIRSSSNWLASSAHLYMRMAANETLFDISRLRTIA
jgi:hypothetical protein